MKYRNAYVYAWYFLALLLTTVFSFFNINVTVSVSFHSFFAGIAIFSLLVCLVLRIGLPPIINVRTGVRITLAIALVILNVPFFGLFSTWAYWPAVWIAIAFASLADIPFSKRDLLLLFSMIFSIAMFFFPTLRWISYLVVFLSGLACSFIVKERERSSLAMYVSCIGVISFISCFDKFSSPRFSHFIPLLLLTLGCLLPTVHQIWAIKKENDAFLREEQHVAAIEEKALREEIRPHFLLNALNSVRVAYASDKDSGKELLGELTRLESMIEEASSHQRIPISQEIAIIRGLIRLFEMERGVRIELGLDIEDPKLEIPPMLLEPLVENSLQHSGILMQERGTIFIQERMEFGYARVVVGDNGAGQTAISSTRGIGLSNVLKRVTLLPEGKTKIRSDEYGTRVEIAFRI